MSAILAILAKDVRLLARDKVALFWVVLFPLLFAVLFGSLHQRAVTGGTALPVYFVGAAANDPRAEALSKEGAFRVLRADEAEARKAVRRGEAIAFVSVAADGRLHVGVDPSRPLEAALLRAGLSITPEAHGAFDTELVSADQAPKSGYELVFPLCMLWGLLGCTGSFAVSMVMERTRGTLTRLLTAPISPVVVLLGKASSVFLACLLDGALITLVCRFAFGVRIDAPGLFVLALLALAICFVGITVLLSVVGKTEQSVGGAGWATLLAFAMLGGGMVPYSVLPETMKRLSVVSPVRWGTVLLEGVCWRGAHVDELLLPMVVLVGIGVVTFSLGALGMRAASR